MQDGYHARKAMFVWNSGNTKRGREGMCKELSRVAGRVETLHLRFF